jgi:hypothetical protein
MDSFACVNNETQFELHSKVGVYTEHFEPKLHRSTYLDADS